MITKIRTHLVSVDYDGENVFAMELQGTSFARSYIDTWINEARTGTMETSGAFAADFSDAARDLRAHRGDWIEDEFSNTIGRWTFTLKAA